MNTAKMMISLKMIGLVTISLTLFACGDDENQQFPGVEDGFSTLTLARTQGYGYCIEPGIVSHGELDGETGMIEGSVATLGDSATDTCLDPNSDICVINTPFDVELNGQYMDEIRGMLAAIPAKECEEDPNLACDPCMITTLEVDGVSVDDYCCGEVNTEFTTEFENAVHSIEMFREMSAPVAN